MPIKEITKVNAAGRQIETAIQVYLEGHDDVSVCVLLHSAWSLIKDLLKGKTESTRDWMAQEYAKQSGESPEKFWDILDCYWNFFKHARKDPKKILYFDTDYLPVALLFVILDFSKISHQSNIMDVFQFWFFAKNPIPININSPEDHKTFARFANEMFPNLQLMPELEQKYLGLKAINKAVVDKDWSSIFKHE